MFISVGPNMGICVPSFLYLDTGYSAGILLSIIGWVPVLNPLLTIWFIVPYRTVVMGYITKKTETLSLLSVIQSKTTRTVFALKHIMQNILQNFTIKASQQV